MKIRRNNTKYYRNYNNLTFENILIKIRRNVLISQLKKFKPKRILEIGCGNTSVAYYYKNFSNFTIIEPSKYFIKKNLKLFKKNKKVTLINSYLENAHDLINKKNERDAEEKDRKQRDADAEMKRESRGVKMPANFGILEEAKQDVKDAKDRAKIKSMGYAKGGKVSSASKRADGCVTKGKTRGKMV